MQKIDVSNAGKNGAVAAIAILYFSVLALFTLWFTQG